MAVRSSLAALFCAAVLLALSPVLPGSALQAQVCPITDPGCSSLPTPGVWIEPETESFSGAASSLQLVVTITWCEPSGTLNAGSRLIQLGGTAVTGAFSYTGTEIEGCSDAAVSTGTITLGPGSHGLTASIANYTPRTGSDSRFYTYTQNAPPTTVAVTPDASAGPRGPSRKETERFTVKNTGGSAATFRFGATCTGGGALSCSATHASALLPAGGTMLVGVNYVTGAVGTTGTVALTAWKNDDSAGVRDAGSYAVTVQAAQAPGAAGDPGVATAVDRAACLMLPAGLEGVYECGDLRLAHALPVTRVLNKNLTPTLLYNSQHAYPYPIVGATVHSPGPTLPSTVTATLTLAGQAARTATFDGWMNGWNRLAVGFDATGLPTGFYDYTFVVKANFSSGSPTTLYSGSGTLAIVNRSQSRFGRGWWMAGVEELKVSGSPAGSLMWIGGDGSTLRYGPAGTNRWVAEPFAGADTIVRLTDITKGYARLITGGDSVVFDSLGRHVRTANRKGHRTEFEWTGDALTRVRLPKGAAFDPGASYRFEYLNPYGMLSTARAPGLPGDRIVTFANTDGRVTAISGPDTTGVSFAYADATPRITARRDRRRVWSQFNYDAGSRLNYSLVMTGLGASDYVPVYYTAQESRGIAATPGNLIYTVFNGPRPDSDAADVTHFWVDRRGAPYQVSDALGNVTRSYAEDPRWPGLVTRVRYQNGREVTAAFDDAGRLAATTDWSWSAGGRYATTLYEWDARCDEVARTTQPEGEVTSTQYNAQCLPEWSQVGQDTATRTRVAYWPANDPRAPGLVRSVTPPLGGGERYEYDTRGNLSATVTAGMEFRTEYLNDLLGRVLRLKTPIDSAQTTFRYDTTFYDTRDRAYRTESYGGGLRLTAVTDFDQESLVRSVSRWSTPDTAKIGTTVTAWEYDALRRRVVEIAPDGMRDSTGYDFAGNVTRTKSRRQHVITMRYDALNRVIERVTPEVSYADTTVDGVRYPRKPNCSVTRLCIPGDVAAFGYDAMGNLEWARNRDASVRRTYHLNGLLKTDTLKVRTWAELAAGGDTTSHVYGVQYTYDLNGRRTSVRYPHQLAARYSSQPGTVHDLAQYGYDPETGALAYLRDAIGNEFRIRYDAAGRPDTILRPRGHFTAFRYDEDGRREWVRHDRTAGDNWSNEIRLRLTAQGKPFGINPLTGREDVYEGSTFAPLDMLLSTTATRSQVMNLSENSESFTPDALANVVKVWSTFRYASRGVLNDPIITTGSSTELRGYQPATGRMLSSSSSTTSRSDPSTPNDGWSRTSQTGSSLRRYDASGNTYWSASSLSAHMEFQANPAGLTKTSTSRTASYYDAENRLRVLDQLTVRGEVGHFTDLPNAHEEYRYDPLGRRVLVRTRLSDRPAAIQRFVWDGSEILAEVRYPGSDSVTAAQLERDTAALTQNTNYFGRVLYLSGTALDQPLSIVRIGYVKSVNGVAQPVEPVAITVEWDWRGRGYQNAFYGPAGSCAATSSLGCFTITWPVASAYLTTPGDVENANTNDYGGWFGSLLRDQKDGSGHHFRRNRYYDPAAGRFTQEDPIGVAGGLNVYGFANGDPITYSDPYGLCPSATGMGSLQCAMEDVVGAVKASPRLLGNAIRGLAGDQLVQGLVTLPLTFVGGGGRTAARGATGVVRAGTRVIGHNPEYVQMGQRMGARFLSIPEAAWSRMSEAQQWGAMRRFLDRGIRAKDEFVVASNAVRLGSWLEKEIKYLLDNGYKWFHDGSKLIPK